MTNTILFIFMITSASTSYCNNYASVVRSFHQKQEYKEAREVKKLESFFLKKKIKNPLAALSLGAYYKNRNPTLAVQYLKKGLNQTKLESERLVFYFVLAQALNSQKKYTEANRIWEKLLYSKNLKNTWGDLDKRIRKLRLITLYHLRKYTLFSNEYKKLRKKSSYKEDWDKETFLYAKILATKKNKKKYYTTLERLLVKFPLTEISLNSFRLLLEEECKDKNKYYFTASALKKLGSNMSLNSGIKEFILSKMNGPLYHNRKVGVLTSLDRIALLSNLRLSEEAYDFALSLYPSYNLWPMKEQKIFLETLGKLAIRLELYKKANKYFSLLKVINKPSNNSFSINEYIADTLSYGGFQLTASNLYRDLAQKSRNPLFRWHHFWTKYTSHDYVGALEIFNLRKGRYVPSRDPNFPAGKIYWKAKVYENTSQKEEAMILFQRIQNTFGDMYYSNLIATKLDLPHKKRKNWVHLNKALKQKLRIKKVNKFKDPRLRIIANLHQFKAKSLVKDLISSLAFTKSIKTQKENLLLLAYSTNNYNLGVRLLDSNMRLKRPYSFSDVTSHQKKAPYLWKKLYPIPHREVISHFSKINKIDPFLVLSIMRAESLYNDKAQSWVGAKGLLQIMPYTAIKISNEIDDSINIDELAKPSINIAYGSWYLSLLMEYFQDNKLLAIAAYNAGPNAVLKWLDRCTKCEGDKFIESISYKETRNYVKKVLQYYARYKRIYEKNIEDTTLAKVPASPINAGLTVF